MELRAQVASSTCWAFGPQGGVVPIPSLCATAPGLREISHTAGVPGATHSSEGWNVNSSSNGQGLQTAAFHPRFQKPEAQGRTGGSELSKHQVGGWGWPVPRATLLQHLHCLTTPSISSPPGTLGSGQSPNIPPLLIRSDPSLLPRLAPKG